MGLIHLYLLAKPDNTVSTLLCSCQQYLFVNDPM